MEEGVSGGSIREVERLDTGWTQGDDQWSTTPHEVSTARLFRLGHWFN